MAGLPIRKMTPQNPQRKKIAASVLTCAATIADVPQDPQDGVIGR
jgi:hypothetical protein